MPKFLVRLWKEQRGQDLVEYALLLLMIALALVASTKKLSQALQNAYADVANTVSADTTPNSGGPGGTAGGN